MNASGGSTRWLTSTLAAIAVCLCASAQARSRTPGFIFVLAQTSPEMSVADAGIVRQPERAFVVQGLETSRQQSELSRLAVSQATRTDIRELAQQLVADYRQINSSLETIARRKAIEVPVQPVSFSDRYRELAEQSGSAFDRAFIHELAEANTRALRLCESAIANTKDADIRELAGNLLPVVRDHVNKTSELEKSL